MESPMKKPKLNGDPFATERLEAYPSPMDFKFNEKRVKLLSGSENYSQRGKKPCIVYYMHRDQRVQDNWAFLYAQRLALKHKLPLHVLTLISEKHPDHPGMTLRNLTFWLDGLREVSTELKTLNIPLHLLINQSLDESPGTSIVQWLGMMSDVQALIVDFSPLRQHRKIVRDIIESIKTPDLPLYRVDAHNVVPVEVTSDKQEYAARTIRSKINKKLDEFLTIFPPIIHHPHGVLSETEIHFGNQIGKNIEEDWSTLLNSLLIDHSVGPVDMYKGGSRAGFECLESFVTKRIQRYTDKRNDPNEDVLSRLSPWFHNGQISVQRAVLYVKKVANKYSSSFVEESIVRRELSDNFCYYNENYDSVKGAADWAQKTLSEHKKDKRTHIYSRSKLEKAKTHDDLWNAAQNQLVTEGKLHGYMRMYWAKKILEWTESPDVALADALYLNDHYALDGNDANGFVGCMWSICGIHDQGWRERSIFGKIRYMNYDGCKRKFNIGSYINRYNPKNKNGFFKPKLS
ncbi:deoxyribodipyrimidine photo-lyase [Lepeophtheirus salmonis]|uniref:deoxyribodipyrimidine photo-lyase n=1 Tax=Lepeophtheirus salmonis TaxID=72036 RepID=UPI001AE371EA|nr:deoxyribodipyrimidine photo-lyase-like [Lepeophtheirus salmonis]